MADVKVPTVFEALNVVKTAIGAVKKGERNNVQNFNFRGIDAVVNAAAPELNRNGVIVTPEVIEQVYETVEIGRNKTLMGHVTVVVKYTFWGPAGDCVSSTVLAESMDSGDKACAKAMSVAFRIALLQTLNLPTDDPDPDSESFERAPEAEVKAGKVPSRVSKPVTHDWGNEIMAAANLDVLRKVWKEAGAAGALQVKLDDGTVQELLYKRSDELTHKSA
jgi:ERF superfamily